MDNVPPALFLKTGRRLADRQQFRGNHDNIKLYMEFGLRHFSLLELIDTERLGCGKWIDSMNFYGIILTKRQKKSKSNTKQLLSIMI